MNLTDGWSGFSDLSDWTSDNLASSGSVTAWNAAPLWSFLTTLTVYNCHFGLSTSFLEDMVSLNDLAFLPLGGIIFYGDRGTRPSSEL